MNTFFTKKSLLILVIIFYSALLLSFLSWGVPNSAHPFTYHMDEWHQLMAVKAIVKYGTTTIPGSAEIPFVYPASSIIYLIPFIRAYYSGIMEKAPLSHSACFQRRYKAYV